jgi:isopentenyl diphosphate isomerase/L-lactate dehydrogenase-like FMN-dependent dehydrogenase
LGGGVDFLPLMQELHEQRLTWRDLEWIRGLSRLPLVLKGILTAEDARLAVEHGVAGIVGSNHGGRQLDRTPATIDVLGEIVTVVGGRAEVYLDGGVRRGTDVLVALGLGARAVFVRRPHFFAPRERSGGGRRVLAIVRDLENAMRLLGTPRIADVRRVHVRRAGTYPIGSAPLPWVRVVAGRPPVRACSSRR